MSRIYLVILLLLTSHNVFADKHGIEAKIDEKIISSVKNIPAWKQYEADALNRKAVIGMPDILFVTMQANWNCSVNSTTVTEDKYRDQYVCTRAFSKKPFVLQGKYFYTEGTIVHTKSGGSYKDGKLSAIQGN